MLAIVNGSVVLPDGMIEQGVVFVQDGMITYAGPRRTPPANGTIIDAAGGIIAPGFVDIHCHGGNGFAAQEDAYAMANAHLQYGTTTILPTIAYNVPMSKIKTGVSNLAALIRKKLPQLTIAGIHMEGPYINRKYGAASHTASNIDKNDYMDILERADGAIKMWTLAPELYGIEALIEQLYARGIVISAGHTEALATLIGSYRQKGLKNLCHLNNAMTFLPKNEMGCTDVGAGAAAFLYDDLYAEVIADQNAVHASKEMLQLIFKIKGTKRTVLITDGTVCSATDTSKIELSKEWRIIDDLRYVNGELSGSCLTMNRAVKHMKAHTGCELFEAVRMASYTPAQLIGLDQTIGSLEQGKKADITILDRELDVMRVMKDGRLVKSGGL